MLVRMYVCIHVLYACMLAYLSCMCMNVCLQRVYIDGGKGGGMGLQPHLVLRVLYRFLIFTIEIFLFQ